MDRHDIDTDDYNQIAHRITELYDVRSLEYDDIKEFLCQSTTTQRVHTTCQKWIVVSVCFFVTHVIAIDHSPI